MIEEDIKKALLNNDQDAYSRLYTRLRKLFLKISYTYFKDTNEDFIQDASSRVLMKLSKFKGNSQFSTWAHRIAVNEALTILRQKKAKPPGDSELLLYVEDTRDYLFNPQVHLAPLSDILADRAVGLNHKELSKKYGCSVNTIKNKLARERARMKKSLPLTKDNE